MAGTVLLLLQSRLTFFGDDWRFLLERRGFSLDAFLDPHNDHIALLPVAIYKTLLKIFGMSSALPFQVLSTGIFLLSNIALFAYLRLRVGDELALLGVTLVLFLGAAWVDLLWSFQIALSGSIVSGLAALLAIERNERRADVIACALLVTATAFSELGIPFAFAALVSVALVPSLGESPLRRRRRAVRAVRIWFLGWGHKGPETFTLHNLLVSPNSGACIGEAASPVGSGPPWRSAARFGFSLQSMPTRPGACRPTGAMCSRVPCSCSSSWPSFCGAGVPVVRRFWRGR